MAIGTALAVAGIGALGSVAGGAISSSSAKKASKTAQASAASTTASNERINAANNALALDIYNRNNTVLNPYHVRGDTAASHIEGLTTGNNNSEQARVAYNAYLTSAGYQTRQDAAAKAVNTGYAARGALESGAAQKALQKNASVLAGDYFGQYMNTLEATRATGLSAASALAGVGQNYVSNVTSSNNNTGASNAAINTGAATAAGNAQLAQGNSWAGALNGVAGAAGSVFGSSYGQPRAYGVLGSGGIY